MTNQELNLACAKFLWPYLKIISNPFYGAKVRIHKEYGGWFLFSPATDANDAMMVFDKLIGDGWEKNECKLGTELKLVKMKKHDCTLSVAIKDIQKANRAILERVMEVISLETKNPDPKTGAT